jgi:uncharacterized protein YvpB
MKSVIKLLPISAFFLIITFGIIYFFIIPPRVITTTPANQASKVALDTPLIIKFDKPIKRQKLHHVIIPDTYGEWKFEGPIIKNHLYRTLIFTPAVDFEPNTQYQVNLENIINPLGFGLAGKFSFSFKTQAIFSERNFSQKNEREVEQSKPQITLLNIPIDWQDYPLSCEAASLKMALAYKGVYVSEDEIMEKIGYTLAPRRGNIWGDPYKTYVGQIDGRICQTGYGVYWPAVAKAAQNWREVKVLSNSKLEDLIKEIQLGNPVIVWGVLPVGKLTDCSWYTLEGKYIKAFKETHVRLVIGFIGEAENPSKIILNDPLAGRLYWPTSYFLKNWEVFNYSGVVIL